MLLQDIITSKAMEGLQQLRISLRRGKARDLFNKLRKRVKRDDMLIVSHRGKIKKVFYCGKWKRPVIINDKLCLLSRDSEPIELLS